MRALMTGTLGGLVIGLALGVAGTFVWLAKPAWLSLLPNGAPRDAQAKGDEQGRAHGDDDEHDHGEEAGVVRFTPEMMQMFGVEVAEASSGTLEQTISLPAQVKLNADRLAHIVPRVSGMVREVHKNVGDGVQAGELLAVLDSRELAEAKAADLAADAMLKLARASFERARALLDKQIGTEEDFLKAKQGLAQAEIEHRTAEAKLHALGLTQEQVDALHASEQDFDYPRYEIRAALAGTVIEKHIVLGEVVDPENSAFALADLSTVWVDVTVYTSDLAHVRVGTPVTITADGVPELATGKVSYVSATVSQESRTAFARVALPNPNGLWRPGMFCTAALAVGQEEVDVLVPTSALQTIENQTVVFVEDQGGFRKQPVIVGKTTGSHAQILSGLSPGDRYVVKNAFLLKAELGKGEAEHEH